MAETWLRCSFTALFVMSLPLSAVAQPVVADTGTEVRAEGGAILSRGNSDNQSFNAKFKVEREWRRWKQALATSGVYAADREGATGQRWDVRGQTDYKFLSQGFSFLSGRYEEDRFSGFEYQAAFGTGLGWRFFDNETTRLIVQAGVGYRRLRTHDSMADDGLTFVRGTRQEDFVQQGSIEFEHALNQRTRVRDQLLVENGADNTQVSNDITLQVRILNSLALAVGYTVRYNTHPPAGFATTDTLSTLNLVYELKQRTP